MQVPFRMASEAEIAAEVTGPFSKFTTTAEQGWGVPMTARRIASISARMRATALSKSRMTTSASIRSTRRLTQLVREYVLSAETARAARATCFATRARP